MRDEVTYGIGVSFDVAFSHDDRHLVVVGTRVVLVDAASGRRLARSTGLRSPAGVAFPRGDGFVLVKGTSGRTWRLDSATLETQADLGGTDLGEGPGPVAGPRPDEFVDASWRGHLCVRDAETGAVLWEELQPGRAVYQLITDPAAEVLAYQRTLEAGGSEIMLREWPPSQHPPQVFSCADTGAIALGGKGELAVATRDTLTVYTLGGDVVATTPMDCLDHEPRVVANPAGGWLLVDNGGASRFDAALRLQRRFELAYASRAAFNSDGSQLSIGGWERGS